jgi:hypothetical protein
MGGALSPSTIMQALSLASSAQGFLGAAAGAGARLGAMVAQQPPPSAAPSPDAPPGDKDKEEKDDKGCKTCKSGEDKKKKKRSKKDLKKALAAQKKMLEAKKAELAKWDDKAKANAKQWFGSDDDATRKTLQDRVDKELALNAEISKDPEKYFMDADPHKDGVFAYVYPNDTDHKIYLDSAYDNAAFTGTDSKAGALSHEMSHFVDIGGTKDVTYGAANSLELAKTSPADALRNADSFEYYLENAKK